ncbi:GAD-like domain-containing protein [Pseudomonas inefficax]|uniref:GAD-like domain-containing protein n=1 Tax=Pseudomonas inefficax TaxID=2078786 RepID=UPI004046FFC2
MDDAYSIFLETIGDPMFRQEVPPTSIDRYRGVLPAQLLEFWAKHGWCGYGNGIFWLVNPQEYEGVLASWLDNSELKESDVYHVIARSAFGDLYLWGERTGPSLCIFSNVSRYTHDPVERLPQAMNRAFQAFLLSLDREYLDFDDLFEAARSKLGILNHDEIYGFVPALTFGGPCDLAHLEKVKAVEHLILLAQISPLEPYSFSDF